MTPERAKELLPIIEAYANGAEIERRYTGNDQNLSQLSDGWHYMHNLMWREDFEYRIKPEPREFWVCWDGVKDAGTYMGRPDASVYPIPPFSRDSVAHWKNIIRVREVIE